MDLLRNLQLLHRNPERRLGMDEKSPIRADPFFNTINWEQLEAGKVEPPYVPKVVRTMLDLQASCFLNQPVYF